MLGSFAILVQAALGALALLSLVFKRWRERPQRPVKIWAFDVSKQVFGTVLLHMANLFMSMFSAGQIQAQIARAAASAVGAGSDPDWRPNPCSFYLLNLAIDTTLGIPILLGILKLLNVGARYTPLADPPESIKSGYYGDPPRAKWWLKQSLIYFVGLLGMKTCVFFVFQLCPWIVVVGDWALRWTEGNTALQIAFVMLIFPLIMNAFQYYVIDTFIKKRPDAEDESPPRTAESQDSRTGLLRHDEHEDDDNHTIDDDVAYKTMSGSGTAGYSGRVQVLQQHSGGGESNPSSSSSTTVADRSISPGQLPKE